MTKEPETLEPETFAWTKELLLKCQNENLEILAHQGQDVKIALEKAGEEYGTTVFVHDGTGWVNFCEFPIKDLGRAYRLFNGWVPKELKETYSDYPVHERDRILYAGGWEAANWMNTTRLLGYIYQDGTVGELPYRFVKGKRQNAAYVRLKDMLD